MNNRNYFVLIFVDSGWADPLRVQIIKAHHNWIVVAYAHFVVCYRYIRLFNYSYAEENSVV